MVITVVVIDCYSRGCGCCIHYLWQFWLLIVGCMVDEYCCCGSFIAAVVDVADTVIDCGSFGC